MSRTPSKALRNGASELIREAIEAIGGIRVESLEVSHAGHLSEGSASVRARLIGWTPTLHAHRYVWAEEVDTQASAQAQCDEFLKAAHDDLRQQIKRCEEAGRLGIEAPIDLHPHAAANAFDHLRIDRRTIRLLEGREMNAKAIVIGRVEAMLANHDGDDVVGIIADGDTTIAEGTRITTGVAINENVTMTGNALLVESHIPDTLLVAAVGRPLGAIATLPDAIAASIIIKAERHNGQYALFTVKLDWIRLGDVD